MIFLRSFTSESSVTSLAGITRDGEKEEFVNEEMCLEDLNLYAPGRLGSTLGFCGYQSFGLQC